MSFEQRTQFVWKGFLSMMFFLAFDVIDGTLSK